MLTVGIDILPRSDDVGRKTLGSMTIVSVGGVDDLADYAVSAAEAADPGAETPSWIADTTVAGRDRQRSVWRLVAAAPPSIDDADHVSLQAHGLPRPTVGLPPAGNPRTARTIASMRISDESGLADVLDYRAEATEAANPPNGTAVRIGDLPGRCPRPAAKRPGAPAAGPASGSKRPAAPTSERIDGRQAEARGGAPTHFE
jgi:hypothetical protein